MITNLVTTYINETFSKTNTNLILGDWCYPFLSEKEKFKKIKFHWESDSKKKKDYQ